MSDGPVQRTQLQQPDTSGGDQFAKQDIAAVLGKKLFDRYEIFKVKQGGMGRVYFVTDLQTNKEYAVKTVLPEFSQYFLTQQFIKEIDFWFHLPAHPNVVQAYFLEYIQGVPYLFLEYVDGGLQTSLREYLKNGPLPGDMAVSIIYQICLGMDFINTSQRKEIVHLDLKPENILLDKNQVAKITDFGLSHRLEIINGQYPRVNMGSWPYVSPERFQGEVENILSDIYSLGVIFYEMVTGRFPYPFELDLDPQKQYNQLKDFHKTGPDLCETLYWGGIGGLSGNFTNIISTCLSKSSTQRFQNYKILGSLIKANFSVSLPNSAVEPKTKPNDLHNRARALVKIGNYSESLKVYNQLLKEFPKDGNIWMEAGAAYLHIPNGNQGAALCFKNAISINPALRTTILSIPEGAKILRQMEK